MTMSRKTYVAVAAVLHEHKNDPVTTQIAVGLADLFKADNPAFDRARFYRAALSEE